ncbi:MAG: coproporphyrinogen III oxidase family protein [Coriobacteriaceae bacterium]|nr:coproporphyrinogen III oxidase family protein [Coriobacteriaceae bacterium]
MSHAAVLAATAAAAPVRALYLHVPFCASRCRYCDFATSATRAGDPVMPAYAAALARIVAEARGRGLTAAVRTAYVGGGTPSLLPARDLAGLIGSVALSGSVEELSFEANPESLSDDLIAVAREAGATRVSIGVQSFDDRELAALGRIHDSKRAAAALGAAVASGLAASVDLMCGIPYQTPASWEHSLVCALDLGASHVSCYPLIIEEGTAMERLCEAGRLPWPDDDDEASYMEAARRRLAAGGLARYEVASYAAPGRACEHNIAYWTGEPYLGLGTAAASMLEREGYEALRAAAPSLPAPAASTARVRLTVASGPAEVARAHAIADLAFEVEELDAREAAAEDLMLGLRMARGISPGILARARREIPAAPLDAAIGWALETGLASWMGTGAGARLAPTELGWLMGNELYGRFWGLAADE